MQPYAAQLTSADHAGLVDGLLWFHSGFLGQGLWRVSPITVEMLMPDWFHRKVHAPRSYRKQLPAVLLDDWAAQTRSVGSMPSDLLARDGLPVEEVMLAHLARQVRGCGSSGRGSTTTPRGGARTRTRC